MLQCMSLYIPGVVEVLFEGVVDVLGELHILEHALQLAGEPCPALSLKQR